MRELNYSMLKTEDEIIFMVEKDLFFEYIFEYEFEENNILFISRDEVVFVSLGGESIENMELKFFVTDMETETIIGEFEIS